MQPNIASFSLLLIISRTFSSVEKVWRRPQSKCFMNGMSDDINLLECSGPAKPTFYMREIFAILLSPRWEIYWGIVTRRGLKRLKMRWLLVLVSNITLLGSASYRFLDYSLSATPARPEFGTGTDQPPLVHMTIHTHIRMGMNRICELLCTISHYLDSRNFWSSGMGLSISAPKSNHYSD